MRKPARIVMLPVAVAIVGIVTLLAIPDRQEVTLTTILQLMPGMPEAEVSEILGTPAEDLTFSPPVGTAPIMRGGKLLHYSGENASIIIEFDSQGRLVRSYQHIRIVTAVERARLRLNLW
jgi:hypothetical protein